MADKPTKPPGSITQPADNKNERIAEISNVNRVVSEMQQKVNQQLAEAKTDIGEVEGIENVQSSMVKVLHTLNTTVGSIGYGFAKIAAETSHVSADAIKQYGKAISADIGLNKQNIVATALSQSSPIFGYFAAKFVETDVFQSAKEKMKENISSALGGITSKFREGFGNLISRAKAKGEKGKPIKGIKAREKIPKMQSGGYVEKAGLASLHPAEVVVPIEKILSRIDESIGVSKELALITRRAQLNTLAKMSTYVKSVEKFEKVGIFKGFMKAMKQVQTQYQEPSDIRQLRALLAIQDALGAQIGTWQQVWQKMLINHPLFRNVAFALRGLGAVFGAPFKFVYSIFKSRGGYQSHLSKARNPMKAMVENIGLVYSEGMWRLDNIALFTKATAEATRDLTGALTGKKYPPLEGVPTGVWSFANLVKRFGGLLIGRKRKSKRKALRDIYGGTPGARRISRLLPKEVEEESIRIAALPVSEIHLDRFTQKAEKYMLENKKGQKKLLGYTSNMDDTIEAEFKVTKQMNKRARRKSIFGFLGTGFGIMKGLLSSGIAFLIPLITGGLTALWVSLFPAGLAAAIGTLFASPAILAGAAALAAGSIGAAIGVGLDKLIGISKGFNAYLDRMDNIANKLSRKQTAVTRERFAGARAGGKAGFADLETLKITTQLGKYGKERTKTAGWTGQRKILSIQTGQREFIEKNISEYMKYDPAQLESLRASWVQEGAFKGSALGKVGTIYGAEREAAFLKYAQAKGKLRSAQEKQQLYKEYSKEIWDRKSPGEKVGTVVKYGADLAKEGAIQVIAKAKVLEKSLEKQTEKLVKGSKELGAGISSSVVHATNAVTTHVQNTSSTINNATQRTRDLFSEYDYAVIKGDHMGEDF